VRVVLDSSVLIAAARSVSTVVGNLAAGQTFRAIVQLCPTLRESDVDAAPLLLLADALLCGRRVETEPFVK
jgi:hypothetical protein